MFILLFYVKASASPPPQQLQFILLTTI